MTEHSIDSTKVWLGEPVHFVCVTYRNLGYLQEQKWPQGSFITKDLAWVMFDPARVVFGIKPRTHSWLRCLFNMSKWTWPPGSPGNPQSLPVTGYGCHTSLPTLNFSRLGPGLLFLIQFSYFGYSALFPLWSTITILTSWSGSPPTHFFIWHSSRSCLL